MRARPRLKVNYIFGVSAIIFATLTFSTALDDSKILGMWFGELSTDSNSVEISMNFELDKSGNITGKFRIQGQNAIFKIEECSFDGQTLKCNLQAGMGVMNLNASFNENNSVISGVATMGEEKLTLEVSKNPEKEKMAIQNRIFIDLGDLEALQRIYDDEMKGYHSMSLFPGTTEMMDGSQGSGPHGRYVTVYINDIGLDAINDGTEALPDGTLIIKDAFRADKKHHATVIMKKVDGLWNFGGFYPPGKANKFGIQGSAAVSSCTDCHTGAKKDMVFVWKQ